jgi:hypothetical protein
VSASGWSAMARTGWASMDTGSEQDAQAVFEVLQQVGHKAPFA